MLTITLSFSCINSKSDLSVLLDLKTAPMQQYVVGKRQKGLDNLKGPELLQIFFLLGFLYQMSGSNVDTSIRKEQRTNVTGPIQFQVNFDLI